MVKSTSFPVNIVSLLFVLLVIGGCSSNIQKQEKKVLVFPSPPDQARFYFERTLISSNDVEHETEDSKIARFISGTGNAARGMGKPYDIAVHKGRIYVSDPPLRTVHIFDPHEYFYARVEQPTGNVLVKPFSVDVDKDGNLYVMDQSSADVKIYNRDGKFLRKFGYKDLFSMPTGVAVNDDASKFYVSDTGGVSSDKHHVLEFDGKTGELLRTIGARGTLDLQFNLPKDITVDDNLLYVVDSGNFRVQVINLETLTVERIVGGIGRRSGNFSRPRSISLDKDKNIYVSDAAFGNFQIFNPNGQLLLYVGSRGQVFEPAKYMLNSGIAVDEDGRVLMADQYFRKIDIFRPAAIKETDGYLGIIPPPSDEEYNKKKGIVKE